MEKEISEEEVCSLPFEIDQDPGEYLHRWMKKWRRNEVERVRLEYIPPSLLEEVILSLAACDFKWISIQRVTKVIVEKILIGRDVRYLDFEEIDMDAVKAFSLFLTHHPTLVGLKWRLNSRYGFDLMIVKSLRTIKNLIYLHIDGILDQRYLTYIADTLETCHSLLFLSISHDPDEADTVLDATDLGRAVGFSNVRRLELHGRFDRLREFCNAIQECVSLTTLVLNVLPRVPLVELEGLLSTSYTLQLLFLKVHQDDHLGMKRLLGITKSITRCAGDCDDGILEWKDTVHENSKVFQRRLRRSRAVLDLGRKLSLLQHILSPPVEKVILQKVAPLHVSDRDWNCILASVLDRQSIGSLVGPFPFSCQQLLQQCHHYCHPVAQIDRALIKEQMRAAYAPIWFQYLSKGDEPLESSPFLPLAIV
jgi:hypothetical protein